MGAPKHAPARQQNDTSDNNRLYSDRIHVNMYQQLLPRLQTVKPTPLPEVAHKVS